MACKMRKALPITGRDVAARICAPCAACMRRSRASTEGTADYEQLPSGPGDAPKGSGLLWRLAVVGSAVAGCFFDSGLVFGYSAIFPQLVAHGAFHDKCHGRAALEPGACNAQTQALTGMFTLATSALNILSIVSGAALDSFGPSRTAGCAAALVAAGSVLYGAGGPGDWEVCYIVGFLLMGVAGPVIFVSSLSFPNLFPGRQGLCTAALVGCFDASSAIFVGLAWLIKGGESFRETFTGYALVPTFVALVAFCLWPKDPVQKPSREGSGSSAGGGPSLAKLSLWKQARTLEYVLLVQTFCIGMVCINFFIATCDLQMLDVNSDTAAELGQAFSSMLPLGGIVYIPLVGFVVDHLGPTIGFAVLWASLLAFSLLNAAYALTGAPIAAYAAFAVFAWCRPLFYTLGAAFTGHIFGFATFGKLYGLLNTLAGLANCSVQPLQLLADSSGFQTANAVLLVAEATMVALPLVVLCKERKGCRHNSVDSDEMGFVRSRAYS